MTSPSTLLRTGFIGIGSQGGPMAMRIARAGMPLTVWARRPEALAPFTAAGALIAASISELGARCDHVGVCVVNDADVFAVCDELIPAMRRGSRIAIHATVLPESVIALAARAGERGIALIDAPVSGGGPGAEAGTLTVMCGGDPGVFEACRPVFECFGKTIVLLGGVGAGQRAKIVNNALFAAHMGLAHAALASGEALGIDRGALAALIRDSSGRSFGFDVCARLPSPAAFAIGAPLLVKDVRLLNTVLRDDEGAALLRDAAAHFLTPATGEILKD